jgi:hypothetical protein
MLPTAEIARSTVQKSFKQWIPDLKSGNEQVREASAEVCRLDLGGKVVGSV